MAKYLKQENGSIKEEAAINTSTGAGDAGKIPALGSGGRLDISMMPAGMGADTASVVASENLSAGDLVNIYDDSGTSKCRKADATTAGKEAVGFVLTVVNAAENATVYFEGCNDQLTSLTAGVQFLSTTAGGVTSTAPSASGNIVQRVGYAVNATTINVEFSQPIELA